jgi:hypothetical protein
VPRGYIDLWTYLNGVLLNPADPTDDCRVRIRLIGGAVYGSGASGNIYLDGQSFGQTGARAVDGSECVNYKVPSGNALNVSDYEGWFYLAPTVYVTSVVIQGLENNVQTPVSAVTVVVNILNRVTGLQVVTPGVPAVSVTNLQALITLSYPPIAPTTVTLSLSGTGAGTVVSVAGPIIIPAGTLTGTAAINILSNPGLAATGAPVTNVVTLVVSVATAVNPSFYVTTPPTLSVTGVAAPTPPPPPPPIIVPPVVG